MQIFQLSSFPIEQAGDLNGLEQKLGSWFAGLTLTWIDQDMRQGEQQDSSASPVLDSFVGYRLPQRRGMLTLEARNILDEEFSYQDDSFRTTELPNPVRLPSRSPSMRTSPTTGMAGVADSRPRTTSASRPTTVRRSS